MSGPASGCAQEGKDSALQRGHWSVVQSVTGGVKGCLTSILCLLPGPSILSLGMGRA